MSQDNQFHQYGYGHYLKAPKKPNGGGRGTAMGGRSSLKRQMQSPAVATVALVAAAALFAGIIVFTYPEQEKKQKNIPIVSAPVAVTKIKNKPSDRGGMTITNRESTILGAESRSAAGEDARAIENLLDYQQNRMSETESRVMKEQALAQAMEQTDGRFEGDRAALEVVPQALRESEEAAAVMSREWIESAPIIAEGGEIIHPPRITEFSVVDSTVADGANQKVQADVRAEALKTPEPPALVDTPVNVDKIAHAPQVAQKVDVPFLSDVAQEKVASTARQVKPAAPQRLAQAQPAPAATMDFVRDALNVDDETQRSVPSAQDIEPAAGVAVPSTGAAYGVYYVQLASITDSTRAAAEWGKIQKQYGVLTDASYRVQNAVVNGRTFYRIQAGPMSRIRANDVCDALKKASKPGGCLVVSK